MSKIIFKLLTFLGVEMTARNKDLEASVLDRNRGKSRTLFKDTLTRALLENNAVKLRVLCEQLIDIASNEKIPISDRLPAVKLIMDRVDGRPAQSVEITDTTLDLPSAGSFKLVRVENDVQ